MNRILASLLGVDQSDNSFLSGDYDVNRILQKPRSSIDTLMQPISEDPIYARNSGQITDPSGFGNVDPYNHAALDRLNQLYGQMPQRQEPNLGRRIVSSLAGMSAGGPATYYDGMALGFKNDPVTQAKIMDLYNYKPYYDQLDDFNQKAKLAGDIARFEQVDNENTRRFLYDQQRDKNADRRQDEVERYNRERIRQGDEKQAETEKTNAEELRLKEERDKAYIWKQTHPAFKAFTAEDGEIVFVDPTDPSIIKHTGIDSGKMSDADKLQFDLQGDLKKIAATGAQQRATEAVKEGNRQSDIAARGDQQRQTNAEKPPKAGSTGSTSVQQKIGNFTLEHPEWSKWISVKNGVVSVKKPGILGGPDQKTYDDIVAGFKAIGAQPVAAGSSTQKSKKAEADAAAYLRSKGRVVNDATIKAALAHQDEW